MPAETTRPSRKRGWVKELSQDTEGERVPTGGAAGQQDPSVGDGGGADPAAGGGGRTCHMTACLLCDSGQTCCVSALIVPSYQTVWAMSTYFHHRVRGRAGAWRGGTVFIFPLYPDVSAPALGLLLVSAKRD